MAIIKCTTCGKNVSDEEPKCPNCGNDLDKNVYCPKCGSADTSVLLKWGGGIKTRFLAGLFCAIFDGRITGWRTAKRIYDESEYNTNIKWICNDCSKKFKVK